MKVVLNSGKTLKNTSPDRNVMIDTMSFEKRCGHRKNSMAESQSEN
jgi:hypothetical protein